MYTSAARVYHQAEDKLHKKGFPNTVSQTVLPVPHPVPNTEWMIHTNPLSVLPDPLTPVPAPTNTGYMEIVLVDDEALRQPRSCVSTVFSFLKSLFTVC